MRLARRYSETPTRQIERISSIEAINIPDTLTDAFDVKPPRNMTVSGDVEQADDIWNIYENLGTLSRFYDKTHIRIVNSALQVLTLPHGKGKDRIVAEHPYKLVAGHGIEAGDPPRYSPTTEVLFVGPNESKKQISPEATIWLGRALASAHVERIYYLGEGVGHIDNFERQDKVKMIGHYLDTFRLTGRSGILELGLIEAMDNFDIDRSEAIK